MQVVSRSSSRRQQRHIQGFQFLQSYDPRSASVDPFGSFTSPHERQQTLNHFRPLTGPFCRLIGSLSISNAVLFHFADFEERGIGSEGV